MTNGEGMPSDVKSSQVNQLFSDKYTWAWLKNNNKKNL
jgi:hypothetical protein